jgi:hypothetical protein
MVAARQQAKAKAASNAPSPSTYASMAAIAPQQLKLLKVLEDSTDAHLPYTCLLPIPVFTFGSLLSPFQPSSSPQSESCLKDHSVCQPV